MDTIKKLSALHEQNLAVIESMGRAAKNARILFSYLEQHPIIDIRKTADELGMAFNTVSSAVKRFEECGILRQTNNASRNRVFEYEGYLEILRKDT